MNSQPTSCRPIDELAPAASPQAKQAHAAAASAVTGWPGVSDHELTQVMTRVIHVPVSATAQPRPSSPDLAGHARKHTTSLLGQGHGKF